MKLVKKKLGGIFFHCLSLDQSFSFFSFYDFLKNLKEEVIERKKKNIYLETDNEKKCFFLQICLSFHSLLLYSFFSFSFEFIWQSFLSFFHSLFFYKFHSSNYQFTYFLFFSFLCIIFSQSYPTLIFLLLAHTMNPSWKLRMWNW